MEALINGNAPIFLAIALAGMLAHAVKKWAYREIRGKLVDWYVMHPRASVGALLGCFGGLATALLTGTLHDPSSSAEILAAFGIGWGADTFNTQGRQP